MLPPPSRASVLAALAPLSRREVLTSIGLLLAGAGLGACADDGPATVPGSETAPARLLGDGPYRTLHALADAVLPAPPTVTWDAGSLRVAERLATLFEEGGEELLETARAGLQLLEHGPVSSDLSRFSRASQEQRLSILRAWADSRVPVKRLVASSLRRAVMFTAYSTPETWAVLGYDGPWIQPGSSSVCPLGMGAGQPGDDPTSPLTWDELGA